MIASRSRGAPQVWAVIFVAMGASAGGTVGAQANPPTRGAAFTWTDAGLLGAAGATAALLVGSDLNIARQVRESPLQNSTLTHSTMNGASLAGGPGTIVFGAALWADGRIEGDRMRERIGLRSLEAVAAGSALTELIKGIAGRARPDASPDDAQSFVLGRGFGDRSPYQSFPSGHATSAFAFASAVDAEWARLSPRRPAWVAPVLYAGAALTGVSRVYLNRHWASDVVLGSAIGFIAGRAVVRWHADTP
jgi:membrane-associated phospholipid phosphatase